MMGQRPPHRDTGLLSARAFQEHTLPEKSLSQPPATALLHNSLSQSAPLSFSSESGEARSFSLQAWTNLWPPEVEHFSKGGHITEVLPGLRTQRQLRRNSAPSMHMRHIYTEREHFNTVLYQNTTFDGWEMCCHFKRLDDFTVTLIDGSHQRLSQQLNGNHLKGCLLEVLFRLPKFCNTTFQKVMSQIIMTNLHYRTLVPLQSTLAHP